MTSKRSPIKSTEHAEAESLRRMLCSEARASFEATIRRSEPRRSCTRLTRCPGLRPGRRLPPLLRRWASCAELVTQAPWGWQPRSTDSPTVRVPRHRWCPWQQPDKYSRRSASKEHRDCPRRGRRRARPSPRSTQRAEEAIGGPERGSSANGCRPDLRVDEHVPSAMAAGRPPR